VQAGGALALGGFVLVAVLVDGVVFLALLVLGVFVLALELAGVLVLAVAVFVFAAELGLERVAVAVTLVVEQSAPGAGAGGFLSCP
jgi:hypothetical protein